MKEKFGLTQEQFELLNQLVINPFKNANAEIWIFGSRARGDQQKFSDVDILIKGDGPGLASILQKIKEDIEESNFPYKVDLVLIDELAESYRESVLKDRVRVS